MRVSRHIRIVPVVLVLLICGAASATQAISYRWQSPHVSMVLRDSVGTPIPPSFGFHADLQDLGHKKRLAESFMSEGDTGLIGEHLDIGVALFEETDQPTAIVLIGQRSKAQVDPPFTDDRFVYALQTIRRSSSPTIPAQLSTEQQSQAREWLARYPDDGFPMLSPGGTRTAFLSWRAQPLDAYVASLNGTRPDRLGGTEMAAGTPVEYTHGVLRAPAWSPSGQMIAYIPDGRVAVVRTSTGGRFISPTDVTVSRIEWSPDARWIAGVVGAMEQNVDLAQGVMLLDPTCERAPVSLSSAVPIFEYGDFATRTAWSPGSRTLAVMVNTTGGAIRDTSKVREGRGAVYLVDTSTYGSRAYDLNGDILDSAWDCRGEELAVVVRPRESSRSSLVLIDRSTGRQRVYYSSRRDIIILGVYLGRIAFLDGDVPRIATPLGVGRIAGVGVDVLPLVPGYYGGYYGVDTEIRTDNEIGRTLIIVEDTGSLSNEFPCLPRRIVKDYVTVLIVPRGTFDRSWTRSFVDEYDIVSLDWSPTSGIIATSSPNGACFRMLRVLPDHQVIDITDQLKGAATIDRWRGCDQRME